ncbi:MAG: pilin [bacterium]
MKKILRIISLATVVLYFKSAFAEGYQPLAQIPALGDNIDPTNLSTYLQHLFEIGIGVAAGLAVIMIVIGGIEYMSTDAIGGKEEGKDRITSALWGLLLALVAWLILNTINPALLNMNLQVGEGGASGITAGAAATSVGSQQSSASSSDVGSLDEAAQAKARELEDLQLQNSGM